MVQEPRVGYHAPSSEPTTYSDEIAIADEVLSAKKRLRERVGELHANTVALMLRYRRHRFPRFTGASDTNDEQRVRELLRDLATRSGRPRSYVGYSRGSVCKAWATPSRSTTSSTTWSATCPRYASMPAATNGSSTSGAA
jgi:hypothetical protein